MNTLWAGSRVISLDFIGEGRRGEPRSVLHGLSAGAAASRGTPMCGGLCPKWRLWWKNEVEESDEFGEWDAMILTRWVLLHGQFLQKCQIAGLRV